MTAFADWQHFVADIGNRQLNQVREATADELIELARELDVPSVQSLRVSYAIKPLAKERFTFSGELDAAVTQACVITLEHLPKSIKQEFAIELVPSEALDADGSAEEADLEVLTLPDVEPIEDGRIDVGTIVFGILSAALDPYPRSQGAEFDWVDPKIAADPGAASPFAALSKLKSKE